MTKTEMKLNVYNRIAQESIIFSPSLSVTVVQYLTVYPIFHRFEWLYSHEVTPYIYSLIVPFVLISLPFYHFVISPGCLWVCCGTVKNSTNS